MFLIGVCLALPGIASAGTHWVSATGAAAWANCSGATPLSGASACSLSTANSNAAAGDTVYLRAGTYSGVTILPSNNGTNPASRITFIAYTGETVTFSGGNPDFELSGSSYIRISGITFTNTTTIIGRIENGANHNEIDNNTFTNTDGGNSLAASLIYLNGAVNQNWVTHNWIHNNTFNVSGQAHGTGGTGCTDGGGDDVWIGGFYPGNSTQADNYNTVENNVFSHGPHALISYYGMYGVVRNNVLHNEPWSSGCSVYTNTPTYSSSNPNYSAYNGTFAHRDMQISEDYNRTGTFVLVEGNRFGYAGINDTNDGADNLSLAAPQNIVRYNFFYASMNPGLLFKYNFNSGLSNGGHGGTYNRVFNNTFYSNGYGYPLGKTCGASFCPLDQANIALYNDAASGVGNVVKNNLMYLSSSYTVYGSDVMNKSDTNGWSGLAAGTGNNWCTGPQSSSGGCSTSGDPKFNNPDLSNPASTTLPDLSLQSSSTAIDGGTYLTTATNSGSGSTTLTVADALYFQDGTWGSDLAKASAGLCGSMQADWIAIGTVTNVVQISSVTYGTYNNPAGTITLASPMTWSNGAHIWLQKKSDGALVLAGAAPDYGASEYGGTVPPQCVQAAVGH